MVRVVAAVVTLSSAISCLLAQPTVETSVKPTRLVMQLGHHGEIWQALFSPSGRAILTASYDGTAKLWDVQTGDELASFSHKDSVDAIAFSPDGKSILTGGRDRTVKLWDLRSAKELSEFRPKFDRGGLSVVEFSPDGRTALVASQRAELWDLNTRVFVRSFGTSAPESAAFSPSGKQVLVGDLMDADATLYDVGTGAIVRGFKGPKGASPFDSGVPVVAFSPDESKVLVDSTLGTTTLWDVASGTKIFTLRQIGVGFTHDGRRIVTRNERGTIKFWDSATGIELQKFETEDGIRDVVLSPDDSRVLAVKGNVAEAWDAHTGDKIATFRGQLSELSATVSVTTSTIVFSGQDQPVRVWDITRRAVITTLGTQSATAREVILSSDGRRALTVDNQLVVAGQVKGPGIVRLWDLFSGRELQTLHLKRDWPDDNEGVYDVCFSPDDKKIAAVTFYGAVTIWDAESGRVLKALHSSPLLISRVLRFSPDGHQIFVGGDEISLLWDAETGSVRQKFAVKNVVSAAFSPDGKRLAVGAENVVTLLDPVTAVKLRDFRLGSSASNALVFSVSFSRSGAELLAGSADHETVLWNAETGAELRRFIGKEAVHSARLSADERTVITESRDGIDTFWNVQSGQELGSFAAFSDGTWAVVDPDGRYDAANADGVAGLHWVIGETPIALAQLKEQYYAPYLLARLLGYNQEPVNNIAKFDASGLFPRIETLTATSEDRKLHIQIASQGGGIGKVRVLANGKEIVADARGPGADPKASSLNLSVDLSGAPVIPGQKNNIGVVAWNAAGRLSSPTKSLEYQPPGAVSTNPPEFWAIVAGISEYSDAAPKTLQLNFAAKDAQDMAHALELGADRLFGKNHVHIAMLSSPGAVGVPNPSKSNLRAAFEGAQKARPEDVLLVYLAGHGVAIQDLYAYPTQEARTLDLSDSTVREHTSITSQELIDWIKKIPAVHQVMILDTCAAGAVAKQLLQPRAAPSDQLRALNELKDRTGFHVLMGSAADAVSYEASPYAEGLLTYALLRGMKGAALKNDVDVDVSKLFNFAADDVEQLAKELGGIQRPQLISPTLGESFDIGQLSTLEQQEIFLAQPKPLYLRPTLVNAQGPDDLGLVTAVRQEFRNRTFVSTRGQQSTAVYVDADDMAGAIKASGTYALTGEQVNVEIWLEKNQAKSHVVISGSSGDVPALAHKIVSSMLDAGNRL